MVAYSFNKRFVPGIMSGVKDGTIRAPRRGVQPHARLGQEIQIYTGLRTKHVRLIGRATCLATEQVILRLRDGQVCFPQTAESLIADDDLATFARRDGFVSWSDLVAFWRATHPGVDEFHGVQVWWGATFRPATIVQAA